MRRAHGIMMMNKDKEEIMEEFNADNGDMPKMIQISEEEYKKLLQDVAEYKDKNLRLYADFQNVQKRTDREKQEFVKYANEELIVEFLDVLDNLERTVQVAQSKHDEHKEFLKGVEMVMAQIYEMLARNNVRPIEAKGKPFDPHFHEILLQEETSDHDEGIVMEEFQKGYVYGDKVIRTVKVKIAKAKSG